MFIWSNGTLFCQPQSVLYPIKQSQIGVSVTFNPAFQNLESNLEASTFSKVYLGAFANNNLSLFSFTSRIAVKRSKNYHNLGFSAYYDKEGSYFNRNRAYGHYAYVISLNKKWNAGLGLSVGASNYKIGNSDYFQGGNDNAIDANLGFVLKSDNLVFGISLMQLTQSKLRPINEVAVMKRYLNFFVVNKKQMNKNTYLNSYLITSIYQDRLPMVSLSSSLVYRELISLGVITRPIQAVGIVFGLENIKFDKHSFKLLFSYETNIGNSYKNNSAELTLKYWLPKKKLPFNQAKGSKKYKK